MADKFLYEELDAVSKMGFLKKEIPDYLKDNLNTKFQLRPYQEEAFARFFHCLDNDFPGKDWPLHFLFNMATGSGKTLIMAGLILYLYEKGYRNFLFFVNSTNIIEKTKDNFLNQLSSKFLFTENIRFGTKRVNAMPVTNFEGVNESDINICFTTIQKLHSDLTTEKENAVTYEDFKDKKIVLLADEAHHMNTRTKAQREMFESWENTVERIFHQNEDNLLLEFTATLDYTHSQIAEKYRNKVLYRYDLRQFRNDGYSKDVYIVQADFE
jgi:type III restriction enzyme